MRFQATVLPHPTTYFRARARRRRRERKGRRERRSLARAQNPGPSDHPRPRRRKITQKLKVRVCCEPMPKSCYLDSLPSTLILSSFICLHVLVQRSYFPWPPQRMMTMPIFTYVLPDCILFYFPPLFRTFYPFLLPLFFTCIVFPRSLFLLHLPESLVFLHKPHFLRGHLRYVTLQMDGGGGSHFFSFSTTYRYLSSFVVLLMIHWLFYIFIHSPPFRDIFHDRYSWPFLAFFPPFQFILPCYLPFSRCLPSAFFHIFSVFIFLLSCICVSARNDIQVIQLSHSPLPPLGCAYLVPVFQ
jgi:hypothetical protein